MSKDEKVEQAKIEEEMKRAYIDYAMSVIVARALPSAEDGLKPVQRRILYAMNLLGMQHNKPTKKTARIVGEVIGKYHPHGDIAVYDALVRMAQNFSLRYPLIEGQGNFGSIDGDPPAAMRYTEARLSAIAEEMLQDIDKKTVKMVPNFDNSLQEPEILPAKLPNLLINGSQGIAVGMMTNIPPHNLNEVADAIVAYIKNPKITIEELMKYIQGPDFPTAASVFSQGIDEVYKTGKGSIIIKGKATIEQKKEREYVVITELPYQTNKAELIKQIAELVRTKKIEDISDIRDESAKDQIRIVLVLRRGANAKLILNKLFKLTPLQTKFNAIMLALVQGRPQILNLKQLIECYVKHRQHVIKRRTQFDLQVAQEHEHILEGLLIALKNLDDVVSLIKKSKGVTEASNGLITKFKLSQKQAQAILEMKLQRLTQLEQEKLKKDFEDTKNKIKELQAILASEQAILDIIKQELQELKRKYGDSRKTQILERAPKEVSDLELVKKEQVAVMLTAKGYIKRMPLRLYQEQRRGGKGITGTELTTGDFVERVFVCSTHDFILFLTERGRLYLLKAYNIPEATRYSKGKAIINLLQITDKIKAVIPLAELKGDLFIITKKGIGKKIGLEEFVRIKQSGVIAAKLPTDDAIVEASLVNDEDEIFLATKKGIAIRFDSSEIRKMGKSAYGVTAIKLEKGDEVVGLEILNKENIKESILTVTERGFGKRSSIEEYRKTARACKGIININCSERNGNVINVQLVTNKDSIIVTTAKGMVIRVPCKDIRVMGRNTQGVKIIKLRQDDKVTDVVKVVEANE
ncbi:MAG: DNA gyrase subunit A [Candidatus Pacearchaeota archaeon]|nr:DNA gyrase subunit A [Candidatus Pacearchaeota archaeon]